MGRWGFGRLLAVGVAGILAVLGTASWVLSGNPERLRKARESVTHTRNVLATLDRVFLDLLNAESGARGFAATGDDGYLAPFEDARAAIGSRLARIRYLTRDDPGQQARFEELDALCGERMRLSGVLVDARRNGGAAAALDFQLTGKGRAAMDAIREVVAEMRASEEALLADRTAELVRAEANSQTSLLVLLGFVALLLVGMALLLGAELRRRTAAESRLQAILDHSPAVIYMRDVQGRFLVLSRKYAEQTGIAVEDAMGRTPEELYSPELAEVYAGNHARVLAEGPIEVEEVARAGGRERVLLSLKFPLRDADGVVVGVGGISTDITERKAAEGALRDAKEKAEAANRELEAFSYSVSHDLRAPLRGIDGFSQALVIDESDRLSEKGKDHLRRVRAAAPHMGRLIDDLIDLSRINRTELTRSRVDLSALAGSVMEGLRTVGEARRVEVRVQDGVVAEGDPRLLRLVLENLLENAWKYTGRKDSATIEFGVGTAEGRPAYFVRDDGVGFDMKYAGKLFSPFQRMHSREEFPGTGIGLATVQRILQRHRGRIWAEAAPGGGAAFHFTLWEGGAA